MKKLLIMLFIAAVLAACDKSDDGLYFVDYKIVEKQVTHYPATKYLLILQVDPLLAAYETKFKQGVFTADGYREAVEALLRDKKRIVVPELKSYTVDKTTWDAHKVGDVYDPGLPVYIKIGLSDTK